MNILGQTQKAGLQTGGGNGGKIPVPRGSKGAPAYDFNYIFKWSKNIKYRGPVYQV